MNSLKSENHRSSRFNRTYEIQGNERRTAQPKPDQLTWLKVNLRNVLTSILVVGAIAAALFFGSIFVLTIALGIAAFRVISFLAAKLGPQNRSDLPFH